MTIGALILSGGVLACGALLVLSGALKLYRASRRASGAGNGLNSSRDGDSVGGDGGAIRAALRISPRRWRQVEVTAGVVEAAVGVAVCAAFQPVVAGTALAVLGAVFSALLAYTRHAKTSGGCSCVRRSKDSDASIRWPVQARAAWLLAAGVVDASMRLPRPALASGGGVVAGLVGISTLLLMLAAEELPGYGARCHLRFSLGPRRTLRALRGHGVFEAMAGAVGPFAEGFAYRREGCVEEFRFAATPRADHADRAVAFRVSRAGRGGALAVEARIEAAA